MINSLNMNPYINYYVSQAGSGIRGFSGSRYQRGHGWFSRLFSSTILPALKFLGKTGASTGLNIAEDVLAGKNFKQSAKDRAIESGKDTARKAINRGRTFVQTGKGRKRRKTKNTKNKKCKRIKSTLF